MGSSGTTRQKDFRFGIEDAGETPALRMEDLSLHVLDIAENAVVAGAQRVDIRVTEDVESNLLTIEIEDDGKGMSEEELRKATDPFYSTKKGKKVGLGLSLLSQAAKESEGKLEVSSAPGRGTLVRAIFRADHIDRKPLGNMAETLSALIAGNPHVRFTYTYCKGCTRFSLDTEELKDRKSSDCGPKGPHHEGHEEHEVEAASSRLTTRQDAASTTRRCDVDQPDH